MKFNTRQTQKESVVYLHDVVNVFPGDDQLVLSQGGGQHRSQVAHAVRGKEKRMIVSVCV